MNGNTEEIYVESGPTSWIGLEVNGYLIQKQIGEGSFSSVYLGERQSDSSVAVFKVAKAEAQVGKLSWTSTVSFPTIALMQITGSFCTVNPNAAELLAKQAQTLQSVAHKNLVLLQDFVDNNGLCFYQCEFLEGQTLRQMLMKGEANHSTLIELAQALESLSKNPRYIYHGDLKPDNIIVTKSGIRLIDPGYFGKITAKGGTLDQAAVTTPAYYPTLQPDDLFAFGIIAWEVLVGTNPLQLEMSSDQFDTTNVEPELLKTFKAREATGNFFSSGLLALRNPCEASSEIPASLGTLLLKLLRLRMSSDGFLTKAPGFRSFGAIAGALLANECRR